MNRLHDQFLSPIDSNEFFENYWEQRYLHIQRNCAEYFSNVFSATELENYLSTNAAFYPDVQLVKANDPIAQSSYSDATKKIVPGRLIKQHHLGATIVISKAHKKWHSLAELCRSVNQTLRMRSQTNVYLSPGGAQGFESHYDTHDVFILQISGNKTFRFFESEVLLPFPDEEYDPARNLSPKVIDQVEVNAGDTLYIPRGLVHDAIADDKGPSLHVTLGVFPVIVRDVLQSCIQVSAELDERLRRSIDLDKVDISLLQELSQTFVTPETLNEVLSRASDDFAIDCDAACAGRLSPPPITLDSTIAVNAASLIGYERQGRQLKLRVIGQVVVFDEPFSSAVEQLAGDKVSTVSSLAGLDSDQQIALSEHLVETNAFLVKE